MAIKPGGGGAIRNLTRLFGLRAEPARFQPEVEKLIKGADKISDPEILRELLALSLRELAGVSDHTDQLTAISNRKGFMGFMRRVDKSARMHAEPYSVLFMDVDHFKRVNDTFGHDVGDNVLKAVSQTIRDTVGDRGHVSRFGGEEMVVALPATSMGTAAHVAEEVRLAIARMHDRHGTPPVTISIGVARFHPDLSVKDLFKMADVAVYEAKTSGRDRVVKAPLAPTPPRVTPTHYEP